MDERHHANSSSSMLLTVFRRHFLAISICILSLVIFRDIIQLLINRRISYPSSLEISSSVRGLFLLTTSDMDCCKQSLKLRSLSSAINTSCSSSPVLKSVSNSNFDVLQNLLKTTKRHNDFHFFIFSTPILEQSQQVSGGRKALYFHVI